MNYYVFSTRTNQPEQEDARWEIVDQFDDLARAETFMETHKGDIDLEYRMVPAQTEEDAKAMLDMPNQPF